MAQASRAIQFWGVVGDATAAAERARLWLTRGDGPIAFMLI